MAFKKLKKSEADKSIDLKTILAALPDLYFRLDTQGAIVDYYAGRASDLYVAPEQFLKKRFQDVLPPSVGLLFAEALEKIRGSDLSETIEYELSIKGEPLYFEARLLKIDLKDPEFIVIVRNITRRKIAEKELERSLAIFRGTLESTADGILLVDNAGRIMNYNQRFVEMWRIPESIIASKDDRKALNFVLDQLIDPRAFLAKVSELYADDKNESVDILEFKDGRAIERYSRPQWVGGKHYGRVWSFREITQSRKAEKELQKRADDLARSNAELEQFAYVASHDLQEPLRTIASLTQILESRYISKLDDEASRLMSHIINGVTRMSEMINDLLSYSRLGTQERELKWIDANDALAAALKNLQGTIDQTRAIITSERLPKVLADSTQLTLLFQNLISNALKFYNEEPPKVHISAHPEGGEALFSVKDNGIGIDPKYGDRIFNIFQRLHGRERYPGTGMGLAICKKIVERNGGRIWVDSAEGRGSVFYFTIPEG